MAVTAPDTRKKLIDTALELLWQSSYGSVSVDDICKAANVKKGSFYHFFPSKMDLTLAAMEEDSRAGKEKFDNVFSSDVPALERFERLAAAIYSSQAEVAAKYGHVCGCPCTSLASEMAGQNENIRIKFEEISTHKKRYFENAVKDLVAQGALAKNIDTKAKAEEIYSYILGQLTLARIQNNLELLKDDTLIGLKQILGIRVAEEVN